jgi:hypothetical protein
MDHSNGEVLDAIDFTPETLTGAVVYGANDERIGKVSHVHGMGTASKVIVDVGGFLGIGSRAVMLTTDDLQFVRDADGTVVARTDWTTDEVKALPEHLDRL